MKNLILATLFALIATTGSCAAPTKTVVAPVGPAQEKHETAVKTVLAEQEKTDAAEAKRDSKVAASLEAINSASGNLDSSPTKDAIRQEIGLAKQTLNTVPSETDLMQAMERVRLILNGQMAEALKLYKSANDEMLKARKELSEVQSALTAAKQTEIETMKALDAERAKSKKDLEDTIAAYEKKITEAKNSERAAWVSLVTKVFFYVGLAALIGAAVLVILFKTQHAAEAGITAACGACFLLAAELRASAAFPYILGGASLAILAVIGVFLYKHRSMFNTVTYYAKKTEEYLPPTTDDGRDFKDDMDMLTTEGEKRVIRAAKSQPI